MNKDLQNDVRQWFIDRDLDTAEPNKQYLKLVEETGELFTGIAKRKEKLIKDALGDMQVVLIGLRMQLENSDYQIELSNIEKSLAFQIIWMSQLAELLKDNKDSSRESYLNVLCALEFGIDNIAKNYGFSSEECLQVAYNEIKDRKGEIIDGVYIKEDDIIQEKLYDSMKDWIVTKIQFNTSLIEKTNEEFVVSLVSNLKQSLENDNKMLENILNTAFKEE